MWCASSQRGRPKPPIRLAGPDRQRPQSMMSAHFFIQHAPSLSPPPENLVFIALSATGRTKPTVSHATAMTDGTAMQLHSRGNLAGIDTIDQTSKGIIVPIGSTSSTAPGSLGTDAIVPRR
jgi:hypothetical protein